MKKIFILFILAGVNGFSLLSAFGKNHFVRVSPQPVRENIVFRMGTDVNPQGETIRVTSQGMFWNDKPVVPVMGEIHFSRIPACEWRDELLKMKAGGINIVSTYIFWIHHEEIQGNLDWTEQRNLAAFVSLCQELDLKLILRIGPWCHGEVRNGGLPDWLVQSGMKLRENNPAYLAEVEKWYHAIYQQVEGSLWKDGGPIIGIQIENEYRGKWEHLAQLKSIAQKLGFDVPLYTRTGWPALSSPAIFGELIPLYGDYADGFWDRSLREMPGDYAKGYLFRPFRSSTVIATEQLPPQLGIDNPDEAGYPYFTCELGGGMMPSYHRRIAIAPMDVYAMALVRVGSGSNLPGYYMYHGGTNPDGKLSYLNEMQATPMTNYNDLPAKTYDFQAPLGEFGQVNEHYHLLRRLHLFLNDYGGELSGMPPFFPEGAPGNPDDDSQLRWSVRSNGRSGFVFVNNYQRLKTLSGKDSVQFTVALPNEELVFPESPISVASGLSFYFPFNLRLGDSCLTYATAQPVAKLSGENELTYFFAEIPGIPAHFVFDKKDMLLESGTQVAISFRDSSKKIINIVLLSYENSLRLWKGIFAGKERVFISDEELTCTPQEIRLAGTTDSFSVAVYPGIDSLVYENRTLKGEADGIFTRYRVDLPPVDLPEIKWEKVQAEGKLRTIPTGIAKVAESPVDADFEQAAVWRLALSDRLDATNDLYLQIRYTGDVARIYSGNCLLTDNFYNGKPFELGLKRFAPGVYEDALTLKILPLQQTAPVYFQSDMPVDFRGKESVVDLGGISVYRKRVVAFCFLESKDITLQRK
jgi:hypothetical protein